MSATVHDTDGHCTLRFERPMRQPPGRVWRALTAVEDLAHWFPSPPDADLAPGARLTFSFPDDGAPDLRGSVSVFDRPEALEFTWDGDLLRFELRPRQAGCVLVFTQTFDDRARAVRDASAWHTCLDLLDYRLGGGVAPWTVGERWEQLHLGYVARFAIDYHRDCVCGGSPPPPETEPEQAAGTETAAVPAASDGKSDVSALDAQNPHSV